MMIDWMPDADLVREQLRKLRSSAVFSRSVRLYGMLEFLVEETVEGRGHTLKELVVGEAIYARHTPYDPCIDSTVRVEARRLRRKLADYYDGPGREAPFRIALPGGGYRPTFEPAREREIARPPAHESLVDLAIMPFRALSPAEPDGRFAEGLTDELIHLLDRTTTLRLAPRLAVFQYSAGTFNLRDAANMLGTRAMLHATLRRLSAHMRLSLELSDAGGALLWSERLDAPTGDMPLDEEILAGKIVSCLPGWLTTARNRTPRAFSLVS